MIVDHLFVTVSKLFVGIFILIVYIVFVHIMCAFSLIMSVLN